MKESHFLVVLNSREQFMGENWTAQEIVKHLATHGRPVLRRLLASGLDYQVKTAHFDGQQTITHAHFGPELNDDSEDLDRQLSDMMIFDSDDAGDDVRLMVNSTARDPALAWRLLGLGKDAVLARE